MSVASPQPARITDPHTCIDCGYNLRGLDPAGVCPECGADIHRSLQQRLLRHENPQWLGRVARGIRLWRLGALGIILLPLAAFLLIIVLSIAQPFGGPPIEGGASGALSSVTAALYAIGLALSAGAYAVGTFLVGTRPPAGAEGLLGRWRLWIQWLPIAFLIAAVVWPLFVSPSLSAMPLPTAWAALIAFQVFALWHLWISVNAAELLLRHVPDPYHSFPKKIRSARRGVGLIAILIAIGDASSMFGLLPARSIGSAAGQGTIVLSWFFLAAFLDVLKSLDRGARREVAEAHGDANGPSAPSR